LQGRRFRNDLNAAGVNRFADGIAEADAEVDHADGIAEADAEVDHADGIAEADAEVDQTAARIAVAAGILKRGAAAADAPVICKGERGRLVA